MFTRIAIALMVVVGVLAPASSASGQDKVHSFLNDTAIKVHAATDVTAKREVLSNDLATMTTALAKVEASPLTSADDDRWLAMVQSTLQEKRDELSGTAGFERVPDAQLDAFATYVVQDMEQADQMVNISLVTALLIIIIVILIA